MGAKTRYVLCSDTTQKRSGRLLPTWQCNVVGRSKGGICREEIEPFVLLKFGGVHDGAVPWKALVGFVKP